MVNFTTYCESAANGTEAEAVCDLFSKLGDEAESLAKLSLKLDEEVIAGMDTFFLLFAGSVVFLMQAGFAMLCAGSVRSKNVKNIMLKNLLDACGGALGFFFLGFGVAYGRSESTTAKTLFVGNDAFMLFNFRDGYSELITWFFQFAFAATAATIVAGTVAERCKMVAYFCYSLFLTMFVYPVVVHSTWATDGFLSAFNEDDRFMDQGVIDFAGSGVVHLTGGATALIAAIVLGPRKGRFHDEDGNKLDVPNEMPGHNSALQVLGTFILWFGWYGFNPGSALVANKAADVIGLCAVTTTIAAAAGCVSSMATDTMLEYMKTGEVSYDLESAMNGCLAGLVAITAGCSVIKPWVSFIVGIIGGWVYIGASKLLIKLRIDDVVNAIPVHMANGIWGVIAVGLFSDKELQAKAGYEIEHVGLFNTGGSLVLLGIEIIQILFILGWVSVTMIPFFVVLRVCGMFRADALEEEVGLDESHHRGGAYNIDPTDFAAKEALNESRKGKTTTLAAPVEDAEA